MPPKGPAFPHPTPTSPHPTLSQLLPGILRGISKRPSRQESAKRPHRARRPPPSPPHPLRPTSASRLRFSRRHAHHKKEEGGGNEPRRLSHVKRSTHVAAEISHWPHLRCSTNHYSENTPPLAISDFYWLASVPATPLIDLSWRIPGFDFRPIRTSP